MQQDLITGTRFFGASALVIVALVVAFAGRSKPSLRAYDSAHRLLVAGTMVLGIHNVVQFMGHFREYSAATAWVVNLIFFCVTCPLYNLAEMHLLHMRRHVGPMKWLTFCSVLLVFAICGAGHATGTLINDSLPAWSLTSMAAAVITLTLLVQDYYLCHAFSSVSENITGPEQSARAMALRFTAPSMKFLMAFALITPWSGMFSSLAFHALFGLFMFVAMVWHLANFVLCGRSLAGSLEDEAENNAAASVKSRFSAAEEAEKPERMLVEDTPLESIATKVERWIGEKHYVDPDLKIETALRQMDLSLAKLNFYLENVARVKGYRQWISMLRIEHAKAMMRENPNYTLDAIAGMCGFANRRSLTNVFKMQVGMSPSQWMEQERHATL